MCHDSTIQYLEHLYEQTILFLTFQGEIQHRKMFKAAGRQVVGQFQKVGKSRNFHQKVGKSRNFSAKK